MSKKNVSVKEYFESRAARYEALWSSAPARWYRGREAAALLEMLGSCDGSDVLELGCGSGFYTRQVLACRAHHVTAVDLSPAMVAKLNHTAVTAVCGDAASISLGREFPLVLSAGLLEFVPDPQAVVDNAARALVPGGRLALLVPRISVGGLLYRLYHLFHGVRIRLFSPRDLETLAESCGLRLAASRFIWPFTLVARLEKPAA